jgi:twinkle protein
MNLEVTVFHKLLDPKAKTYVRLHQVLESIRTGGKIQDIINQIRATGDKELKKTLPLVLFGGKFTERRASALVSYSHLICLDFDNVDVTAKLADLQSNEYIYACWLSPSGNGVKALVKVSTDNHLGHALALIKDFPDVDTGAIKDVCRATFMSYDPDIYINKDAWVYGNLVVTGFSNEQKYENLKKWLENKGDKFVEGQRNNFLAKLAGAANRFGVDKEFLEQRFEADFVKGTDFALREMRSVVESVYTLYSEQFNTQSADEVWTAHKVNEVLSTQIVTHDLILLGDLKEDLLKDYDEGTQKAPTTWFDAVDALFRPMRGDLNILTGIGNYGKSAWQKQMDLARAVHEGNKFLYFSPEEYPPLFWYRELVRSYVGKPVEREAPDRMSRVEYENAMEFIKEHFIYIYPPELPTPEYIMERFAEAIIRHGIDGIVLDPWNQLSHTMNKRDDIYLGETLSKFERFAQAHQVYMTIIAHPNRTSKNEDGNYGCPDVYDLNGGPVWNARATNIIAYHRPYYQTDKADAAFEFHSKKIKKQMLSGIPGVVSGRYNRYTGRFLINECNPLP